MKKSILIISIIAFVVLIGILVYFLRSVPNANVIKFQNNNEDIPTIQKVTISYKNYNYYPNTIKVKEGIPVEITLDNSVKGCFRTLVIRDFGVRFTSTNPDQKIIFTPDKKGTFIFACGMHMGTGTLVVE